MMKQFKISRMPKRQKLVGDILISYVELSGGEFEVAIKENGSWEPAWRGDNRALGTKVYLQIIEDVQQGEDPLEYFYEWDGAKLARR